MHDKIDLPPPSLCLPRPLSKKNETRGQKLKRRAGRPPPEVQPPPGGRASASTSKTNMPPAAPRPPDWSCRHPSALRPPSPCTRSGQATAVGNRTNQSGDQLQKNRVGRGHYYHPNRYVQQQQQWGSRNKINAWPWASLPPSLNLASLVLATAFSPAAYPAHAPGVPAHPEHAKKPSPAPATPMHVAGPPAAVPPASPPRT